MPSSSGIEDYDVIEQIGSGSYGTCSKVRRKRDNRILVWKEMEYGGMTETEKQMLVSEVNLLRELRHEHIVRYHDRIIDRSRYVLYIVMEFCEGGDLSSIIGKCKRDGEFVSEDFVWKMCVHLSSALQFCHNRCIRGGRSILHRDLKPANIFLDSEQNAKLGDFGLARVLNHDNSFARTFVGTPYYMSPEQMNCMTYNEKSDVWSLGCLLYELCSLRPPFTASNQKELATKICKGKFPRIPQRFSDDLNNLIAALLRVEDYKRPTIDQVLDHPLLIKNGAGYLQALQKKSSGSSVSSMKDSGDDKQRSLEFKHWEESLRSREEALKEKEELLRKRDEHIRLKEIRVSQRENDVEKKEAALLSRERLIEDRLIRVDKVSKSATAFGLPKYSPTPSFADRLYLRRKENLYAKQTTFRKPLQLFNGRDEQAGQSNNNGSPSARMKLLSVR